MKRFSILLTLLAVAATLLAGYALFATRVAPRGSPPPQAWAAVELDYELATAHAEGTITSRHRLTYEDKTHWRTEILAHSHHRAYVGAWALYDGETLRSFDALRGVETVNRDVPPNGVYVPEPWLNPYHIPRLLADPTVTHRHDTATGIGYLTRRESMPCHAPTPTVVGLPTCTTERITQTNITYRTVDFIPLHIVEMVDGVVVRRTTITHLTIAGEVVPLPSTPLLPP
jgi:hypothetical protein